MCFLSKETELGPVVDDLQFKRVSGYIERGVNEGAKLMCGGRAIPRPGFYLEPTVFADVKDNMTIAKEEIFGPVQTIFKFSSLKEAIARANNTEYGLAAGVFTKDVGKGQCPFFSSGRGRVFMVLVFFFFFSFFFFISTFCCRGARGWNRLGEYLRWSVPPRGKQILTLQLWFV